MSYRLDLDEYDEERLLGELQLREERRKAGRCDYCNRPPSNPACKFPDRHAMPDVKEGKEKEKGRTVVVQQWEESERGWGVRPDGWTMHVSREQRDLFVAAFWKRQRADLGEETPAEYTRTAGEPYEVSVSEAEYADVVKESKVTHGTWGRGNYPPKEMQPPPNRGRCDAR